MCFRNVTHIVIHGSTVPSALLNSSNTHFVPTVKVVKASKTVSHVPGGSGDKN